MNKQDATCEFLCLFNDFFNDFLNSANEILVLIDTRRGLNATDLVWGIRKLWEKSFRSPATKFEKVGNFVGVRRETLLVGWSTLRFRNISCTILID